MRNYFIYKGIMKYQNARFEKFAESFEKHISELKSYLKKQAASFDVEVRKQAAECIKPQGKYLRPLLVYSSAPSKKYSDKELQKRAAAVELIHLASLIHDDVIDNADLRRDEETIFKKFGARTAILLGDAIFAHAMGLSVDGNAPEVSSRAIAVVKTLSQGEIMQTLALNRETDMARYISIIEGKTASLFEFACFLGASLECGAQSEWAKAAQKAGKALGRAYQMYDDICDWDMAESQSGKTAGTDFISEKQTLPVIILLKTLPKRESAKLSKNLKSHSPQDLRQMMSENGVFKKCAEIYEKEVEKARAAIAKFVGKNEKLLEFCDAISSMMPKY